MIVRAFEGQHAGRSARRGKDFRKQFRTRQPRTWYDRIACNSIRGLSTIELTRCLFVLIYFIHETMYKKKKKTIKSQTTKKKKSFENC
jgi:hypothetical protein